MFLKKENHTNQKNAPPVQIERLRYKLPGFSLIWARKGLDEADNGYTPEKMIGWHFNRARLGFLNLFNYENGRTFHPFWIGKQTPEVKEVLDLFVQVAAEKDASWLPEQYPRSANLSDPVHEDGAYWDTPKFKLDEPLGYDHEVRSIAIYRWSFLQQASQKKLFHPALINGQVNFSAANWPGLDDAGVARNPWKSLIVASGAAPSAPMVSAGASVVQSVGGRQNETKKTVKVKWTAAAGVKSYNVKRSDTPNGPFMTVAYFRTAGEYVDEIPKAGRTYYYKMSANSDTSESVDSSSSAINVAQ